MPISCASGIRSMTSTHIWTGSELQVIVVVGGQVMPDTDANSGLRYLLPAIDYYSALCITQLVTYVPLIHAFAPGLHPCVVIHHGEGFAMWMSPLTTVIQKCFIRNDLLFTHFPQRNAISVFVGAVRICVFQLWNTTRGTFQISLQVCVCVAWIPNESDATKWSMVRMQGKSL